MSKKYYAVRTGRQPGIYQTWAEAEKQVSGFKNAEYRSFKTLKEAEDFITPKRDKNLVAADDQTVVAYVDGSFDKASNRYSFGAALIQNGVVLKTLTRVGDNPKYQGSRQIAGEVFGAIHAIHWAIKQGFKKIIIHYDYLGIEKWALGEWKANKDVSKDYIATYRKLAPKIDIEFVKVKAHSGVEYNELVDQLAKDALRNESVD
jgi:ribonuclease HI